MRSLIDYFSLWSEEPTFGSSATTKVRQPILLLGVVVGALARPVLEWSMGGSQIGMGDVVGAIIGGVASFPSIYYASGLNRGRLSLVKWCLAFQNGIFWEAILETAAKAI